MAKLVRDKIPEIILKATGKSAKVVVLGDDEYEKALKRKLQEEVKEFLESGETEELADVLEVVYSLSKVKGVSWNELEELRRKKREERGGFEKKLWLED